MCGKSWDDRPEDTDILDVLNIVRKDEKLMKKVEGKNLVHKQTASVVLSAMRIACKETVKADARNPIFGANYD